MIIGSAFNNSLDANYDSHTIQASGELAFAMPVKDFFVESYAGLSVVNSNSDGFTESGGAEALKVDSESVTALQLSVRESRDQ